MNDLQAQAESVAAQAGRGEQIECAIGHGRGTTVKAYAGEIESFTGAESFGLGIRVIRDGRQGFASAGSIDADVVADTLAEARDNVPFGEVDAYNGLVEPDGVAPVVLNGLVRPGLAEFPVAAKIDLALALERAVRADPRISGVRTAAYGDSHRSLTVATSTGLAATFEYTSASLSVLALAADGESTQTGFGMDLRREPAELDLDQVVADAIRRATQLLGARPAPSQRLRIVLEPRLAATVLGIVAGTLTGDVVVKGRSPFADRIGEQVASPLLTMHDDPTDVGSMAASSLDGEGLATRRNTLLRAGVLERFLHDGYTGRRTGTASTASAVRGSRGMPSPSPQALVVEAGGGGATHEDVVRSAGEGFWVQSLNGLHSGVNAVSGDFSVGAEGRMIRHGELAEPVREVTLASTLQRLLSGIERVGDDVEWLPSGDAVPTLVIGEVQLSGS